MDKKETDIKELVWEAVKSLERIENVLLPTTYNNNKGLVAKVDDHEVRIGELETFKIKKDEIDAQNEAFRKKANEITIVVATVIGVALTMLGIYLSTKK